MSMSFELSINRQARLSRVTKQNITIQLSVFAQQLLNKPTMNSKENIVISGVAGRFPESDNVKELEKNLFNKIDMVTEDTRRFKNDIPGLPNRMGKINNINKFDALFFGINPNQANAMDPICRMLMEHGYEAIIDAGINPSAIKGSKTGVFIGACFSETEKICVYEKKWANNGYGITGCSKAMYANRLSYWLGLTGPSYTIDSACSSSIVAIENAYRSIQSGQCDAALVGAANLCLHPSLSLQYANLGALSPDGYCRTYDADANGFVRAEAVGIIYLQKLKNAKRVYGTIVNCKTNCDGYKEQGITLPSSLMHSNLIRELYEECKVSPSDVKYMEAHGTGTKVGDPEEIMAIDIGLCSNKKEPLIVGSIKTNLGHAEAASGIVSIAKIIIANETGKIPPNLHFKKAKKDLKAIEEGRIKIITETENWTGGYTAVSGLGFGGSNAHCLIQSNAKEKINNALPNDDLPRLVMVSGRTEYAVKYILDDIENRPIDVEFIKLLHDIHADPINGHLYSGYTILNTINSIEKTPQSNCEKVIKRKIDILPQKKRSVWFVFSGMGSQWPTMGKAFLCFPIFAEAIRKCDAILKPMNIDIYDIINNPDKSKFKNILNAFIGIGAIQLGLVDLLKSLEILPDQIIGHSMGEVGCAYADNTITAEQMILAIYYRGIASINNRIIEGSMAVVGLGHQDAKKYCSKDVEIACHNGAKSTTISGPEISIKKIVNKLNDLDIFAREVECGKIAYHSTYITEAASKLLQYLKKIIPEPKKRSSKWLSTSFSQNEWSTPTAQLASAEYFTNNFTSPVLFEETCTLIPDDAITIEVSPHGILQTILRTSLNSSVINMSLAQRGQDNIQVFLDSIGKLYCAGIQSKISNLYPSVSLPVSRGTPMISPLIKWQHSDDHFVVSFDNEKNIISQERTIEVSLKDQDFKYMAGHVVDGINSFPTTFYFVFIWQTLCMMQEKSFFDTSIVFEDIKFLKTIILPESRPIKITIFIDKDSGKFKIIEEEGEIVATGKVYSTIIVSSKTNINNKIVTSNDKEFDTLTREEISKQLRLRGYNLSGLYQGVKNYSFKKSCGIIDWVNNWDTFLANMIQVKLLSLETRSLFVPISIKKLTIDTKMHLNQINSMSNDDKKEFQVFYDDSLDMIVSGGIKIQGIKLNSIARKRITCKPIIQTYKFVCHQDDKDELTFEDAIRMSVQLSVENYSTMKCQILELVQSNDDIKNLLTPIIWKAINEIPTIEVEFVTVAELNPYVDNYTSIPVTVIEPNQFSLTTNALISTGQNILSSIIDSTVSQFILSIKDNNFLLTIEKTNNLQKPELLKESLEKHCLKIIIKKTIGDLTILLLKKCIDTEKNYSIIHVNSDNTYLWIEKLQNALKLSSINSRILLISDKEFENGLSGLMKCLQSESGTQAIRGFILQDDNAPDFNIDNPFYQEQLSLDLFLNVLRVDSNSSLPVWGTYRYFMLPNVQKSYDQDDHAYLRQSISGDMNSFEWHQGPRRRTLNSLTQKNLVKVIFSSINERDVMLAHGKLKTESIRNLKLEEECVFGLEYSGFDLIQHKRVMGFSRTHSLTNLLENNSILHWNIPDGWSLEDGATIPLAYTTAYLALYIYGKIKKGDKILIHQATNVISQAAITLALNEGCEVFVTVKSLEMKKFIINKFSQIKEDHIGNLIDMNFEDMIIEITKGQGVNVVLTFVSDNHKNNSIECLKKGGKFLEIKDVDNKINNKYELLKNINFRVISLIDLLETNNDEILLKLRDLLQVGVNEGIVKPLSSILFNRDQFKQAFEHLMSINEVTEKVIIQIQNENNDELNNKQLMSLPVIPHFYCNPNYSYIIYGGLGGFGLELADWLFIRGAKYLILTSRSGIKNGYQQMKINYWKKNGVKVEIISGKLAHIEKDCVNILEISLNIAPVGGIFNLAVELDDKLFCNHTAETFDYSFKSKAWSTKNLDKLSRKMCKNLENFVVFSSITSSYGRQGMTSYGMTNSIMEKVCEKRIANGLPALSIQWGAIDNVGILGNIQKNNDNFVFAGTLRQKIPSCLDALDKFLMQSQPVVLSMIIPEKRSKKSDIISNIVDAVMRIIGLRDLKMINKHVPLSQLGMDSILVFEIGKTLEQDFNIILNTRDIWTLNFEKLENMQKLQDDQRKTKL